MKCQNKYNRVLNKSCYTPVEALRLAKNYTSRSATGLPNVCTMKGNCKVDRA